VFQPPRFGAKVASFDAAGVQGIPGVRQVIEIPTGVAVLANNFLVGEEGPRRAQGAVGRERAFKGSSAEIMAGFRKAPSNPARWRGTKATPQGDRGRGTRA